MKMQSFRGFRVREAVIGNVTIPGRGAPFFSPPSFIGNLPEEVAESSASVCVEGLELRKSQFFSPPIINIVTARQAVGRCRPNHVHIQHFCRRQRENNGSILEGGIDRRKGVWPALASDPSGMLLGRFQHTVCNVEPTKLGQMCQQVDHVMRDDQARCIQNTDVPPASTVYPQCVLQTCRGQTQANVSKSMPGK